MEGKPLKIDVPDEAGKGDENDGCPSSSRKHEALRESLSLDSVINADGEAPPLASLVIHVYKDEEARRLAYLYDVYEDGLVELKLKNKFEFKLNHLEHMNTFFRNMFPPLKELDEAMLRDIIEIQPPGTSTNEVVAKLRNVDLHDYEHDSFLFFATRNHHGEIEKTAVWRLGSINETLFQNPGPKLLAGSPSIRKMHRLSTKTINDLQCPTDSMLKFSDNSIFDLEADFMSGRMEKVHVFTNLIEKWRFGESEAKSILEGFTGSDLGPTDIKEINRRISKLIIIEIKKWKLSEDVKLAILLAFPDACRIELEPLGGGFSSAMVFRCISFNVDGSEEIPSVCKIDEVGNLADERERMAEIIPFLGDNAPQILSTSIYGTMAVLRIELCGATWCLPGVSRKKTNISTFKQLWEMEMTRLRKSKFLQTLESPKSHVARHSVERDSSTESLQISEEAKSDENCNFTSLDETGADMKDWKNSKAQSSGQVGKSQENANRRRLSSYNVRANRRGTLMTLRKFKSRSSESLDSASALTGTSSLVFGEIETVIGEVFGSILHRGAIEQGRIESESLFADDGFPLSKLVEKRILSNEDPDLVRIINGKESKALVKSWIGLKDCDIKSFFQKFLRFLEKYDKNASIHKRLVGHVHGDLNGANILIDSETIVWLIDFAFSGVRPVTTDCAKLENTILFEYTPLKPDVEDGIEFEEMERVLKLLIHAELNELPPLAETPIRKPGTPDNLVLDQLWNALVRLRQNTVKFCAKDPRAEYLHAARVFFALKTLKFKDITITQKRLAICSALGHAGKLMECISPGMLPSARRESFHSHISDMSVRISADIEALQREQVKYLTSAGGKEGVFLDPISHAKLSVLKCVSLEITEHAAADETSFEVGSQLLSFRALNEIAVRIETFFAALRELIKKDVLTLEDIMAFASDTRLIEASKALHMEKSLTDHFDALFDSFSGNQCFLTVHEFWNCALSCCLSEEIRFCEEASDSERLKKLLQVQEAYVTMRAHADAETHQNFFTHVGEVLPPEFDLGENRRILVIGPPAAGKTVLIRKILVQAAISQNPRGNCLIPVRVMLIDMGRLIQTQKLTAQDDLLMAYLEHKFGALTTKFNFLHRSLVVGRVVLLMDGLDEAGSTQHVILQWLSSFLKVRPEQRVFITMRESGFAKFHLDFERNDFHVGKLQPLSSSLIDNILDSRLDEMLINRDHQQANAIKMYLKSTVSRPEYRALSQNPLMLSLLIHVLLFNKLDSMQKGKHSSFKQKSQDFLSRAELFSLAIDQMLHQSLNKYNRRSGREDKEIERDLKILQTPETRQLLRDVALRVHQRSDRDVRIADFHESILPLLRECNGGSIDVHRIVHLFDINNALQRSITRDHVPLFQKRETSDGSRVFMFTHLALQEHLAAEWLMAEMLTFRDSRDSSKQVHNKVTVLLSEHFAGRKLEQLWWHDVFIHMCELLSIRDSDMFQTIFRSLFGETEIGTSKRSVELLWEAVAVQGNMTVFKALFDMRFMIDKKFSDAENQVSFDLLALKNEQKNTCFHLAAQNNRLELLQFLVNNLQHEILKQRLCEVNDNLWDPGNVALCANNLECHRLLTVTKGDEDIVEEDQNDIPLMIAAVKANDVALVQKLIEEDPETVSTPRGSTKLTPAMWAVIRKELPMLKILVEADKKKSFKVKLSRNGNNVLAFAVEQNAIECVKFLLDQGMSPLFKNGQNDSLLLIATSFGFNSVAAALISAGAFIAEAIMVSAIQGRSEFVKALIEMRPDAEDPAKIINQLVDISVHPLAAACVAGHVKTVALLLSLGADPNLPINVPFGVCALHIATQNGHQDCIALLIDHGANVNCAAPLESEAELGKTALSIAYSKDDSDPEKQPIIDFLVASGAKIWTDMTPEEQDKNTALWISQFNRSSTTK